MTALVQLAGAGVLGSSARRAQLAAAVRAMADLCHRVELARNHPKLNLAEVALSGAVSPIVMRTFDGLRYGDML